MEKLEQDKYPVKIEYSPRRYVLYQPKAFRKVVNAIGDIEIKEFFTPEGFVKLAQVSGITIQRIKDDNKNLEIIMISDL